MTIVDLSRLGTAIFLFALGQHLLNDGDYLWSSLSFIGGAANMILAFNYHGPTGV